MKWQIIQLFFIASSLFFMVSCDTGLGLIETKISGKVIFVNSDQKPSSIESVRILAAEKSLFDNPTLNDIVISDQSVDMSNDTSDYEIFVQHGTYIVVAAIWKERGKDWNYQNILGIYGYDPVHFRYYDEDPIVIDDDRPVASGRDIICDWGFVFSKQRSTHTIWNDGISLQNKKE